MNIKTAMANATFILSTQKLDDNSLKEFTLMIELPDGRSLYLTLEEDDSTFRFEIVNRTLHKAFDKWEGNEL